MTIRVNGLMRRIYHRDHIHILGVEYLTSMKVSMVLFGLVLKIRDYFILIRKVERLKNSHIVLLVKMFMVDVWTVMFRG